MTDQASCEYSVVIPTYNPGEPLIELVDRLESTFRSIGADTFEVLIVDDGSTAIGTSELLKNLAERPRVRAFRLTRNFGKPGAIMCGLAHSRGEWVVTIDDDLQQAPEDIAILVDQRHRDVVVARYARKQHSLVQRVTSAIKHQFDRHILGFEFPISPLKLIRRNVVRGMLLSTSDRPFIPALIQQITTDVVSADVRHHESAYGRSRYTLKQRYRQFLNLLLGNSDLLLRWVGTVGIVTMIISLILTLVIIARKISDIDVEVGWSSLMVAVLMLGGLQLGAVSIMGQYLLRILNVASRKPAFFVREEYGQANPDDQA